MTVPCPGRVPSLPPTAPPAEVVRDHPWPGFALWRGRFWSVPKSPTPLTPRGGVGSTRPATGGKAAVEVEGAHRGNAVPGKSPRVRAIPRRSPVRALGKYVREYGLVGLLAVAVPAALGLMLAVSVARRGVAW